MFEIRVSENDDILMIGRCDAAQEAIMVGFFSEVTATRTVDCAQLEYVSSAGLGILFGTQARLKPDDELIIANLSPHLREVFKIAGFDLHFTIVPAEAESPTS